MNTNAGEKTAKKSMSFEEARSIIEGWAVDHRKYSKNALESESITMSLDKLAEAVQEGRLKVQEDGALHYKLMFPLKGEEDGSEVLSLLNFKPRTSWKEAKMYMKGVKSDDAIGMIHAYVCALTRKQMAIVNTLESRDLSVCRKIAQFFFD